jgi:putative hydrolase of the HAD superfamily
MCANSLRKIRGICFDIGGTLVSPSGAKGLCERIADVVGKPVQHLIAPIDKYLRCRQGDARELAVEFCRAIGFHDSEAIIDCALHQDGGHELYPEVAACLTRLNRYKLSILSNCSAWDCVDLDKMGIRSNFAAILYSYSVGYAKPDPRIFRAAEDAMGMTPEELLLVGDSYSDINGASAAGWGGIVVSRTKMAPISAAPGCTIANLEQLVELLDGHSMPEMRL